MALEVEAQIMLLVVWLCLIAVVELRESEMSWKEELSIVAKDLVLGLFCSLESRPQLGGPELEYLSSAPFFPFFLAGRLTENSLFSSPGVG